MDLATSIGGGVVGGLIVAVVVALGIAAARRSWDKEERR
jgi:hypothetical protein